MRYASGCETALRADLRGDFRLLRRRDHGLAFVDRRAGRRFEVDMLSALGRLRELHAVPMSGRGDDHGVDIFPPEDMAIIAICLRLRIGRFRRFFQPLFDRRRKWRRYRLAPRSMRSSMFRRCSQPRPPIADHRQHKPFVGAGCSIRAENPLRARIAELRRPCPPPPQAADFKKSRRGKDRFVWMVFEGMIYSFPRSAGTQDAPRPWHSDKIQRRLAILRRGASGIVSHARGR